MVCYNKQEDMNYDPNLIIHDPSLFGIVKDSRKLYLETTNMSTIHINSRGPLCEKITTE